MSAPVHSSAPVQPQPQPEPTTTTSTPTPIITDDGSDRGNGSGRGNNPNGAPAYGSFEAGGFIYVVLIGAILVAFVYFGRVFLLKRRERIRRLKDPDFEANPPNYMSHLHDLAVIDASHLRQEQEQQRQLSGAAGGQTRPLSTSSSNVSIINAPPAALIRGNGNGPDGDIVSYYLITPRVLHEHQRQQQQRHARSSSSPSVATMFAQGYGQGERGRRSRIRTETHSSPPHPRGADASGGPFVPMFLAIPPLDPSEPQPPAYEDLSPRTERMNTSPASTTNTTSTGARMSITPRRIDSLPGATPTTPP
ncbi:hypothetical protein EC957_003774 [Mortierella hygrophila]|uniref:Uncharacterized protein n=1 Tax=Mortierella hygrophila TaxID=979708 RepID=A0A9P6F1F4_9FUNG|nr:hypothetical protein EC957_003774 [Mortierella hygrophila]